VANISVQYCGGKQNAVTWFSGHNDHDSDNMVGELGLCTRRGAEMFVSIAVCIPAVGPTIGTRGFY
jgi:hypothetical protein